jgi:hypothetical protein
MKHYVLDGKRLSPFEFIKQAKAKYKWRGLVPVYLMGHCGPNGEKGTKRNPKAPPLRICEQVNEAFLHLTAEEKACFRDLAKKEREKAKT